MPVVLEDKFLPDTGSYLFQYITDTRKSGKPSSDVISKSSKAALTTRRIQGCKKMSRIGKGKTIGAHEVVRRYARPSVVRSGLPDSKKGVTEKVTEMD